MNPVVGYSHGTADIFQSGAGIIGNFLFREDTAVDFSCQLDQWRQLLEIFVQTVVGRILPLFPAVNFDAVHIVQQRSQL